jgi:hypothetical protein
MSDRGKVNIDRMIGSGLGSNSYNIQTIQGRNEKYNSIRNQILFLSQKRGQNNAYNQTLSEINNVRRYSN